MDACSKLNQSNGWFSGEKSFERLMLGLTNFGPKLQRSIGGAVKVHLSQLAGFIADKLKAFGFDAQVSQRIYRGSGLPQDRHE